MSDQRCRGQSRGAMKRSKSEVQVHSSAAESVFMQHHTGHTPKHSPRYALILVVPAHGRRAGPPRRTRARGVDKASFLCAVYPCAKFERSAVFDLVESHLAFLGGMCFLEPHFPAGPNIFKFRPFWLTFPWMWYFQPIAEIGLNLVRGFHFHQRTWWSQVAFFPPGFRIFNGMCLDSEVFEPHLRNYLRY